MNRSKATKLRRSVHLGCERLECRAVPSTVPNDQLFNGMYNLDVVRATDAWDLTTGSSRVVAAVVDGGVDYTHPDLYRNVWLNQAEIPNDVRRNLTDTDADGIITFWDLNVPANQGSGRITDLNGTGYIDGGDLLQPRAAGGWADGRDDGHNGYADDLIGWDFVADDNDPMDDTGHGTHVAGILGATGNNGIGVAGINWRVQIMPVKLVPQATGTLDLADVIPSIEYMLDNGARVSNHSYGAWLADLPAGFVTAVTSVVREAGERGHVFVCSAGNETSDNDLAPRVPASLDAPNVITVAATDRNDRLARFSDWGLTSVDMGAPGLDVWSTMHDSQHQYAKLSGTSMAAPHVTGALALLLARSPNLTAAQLKAAVLDTIDPAADLAGRTVTGGRLNLDRALRSIPTGSAGSPFAPMPGTPRGPSAVHGHGNLRLDGFVPGAPNVGGDDVATADFNGDGKADLVQTRAGAVEVLLGRGDGTFLPGRTFAAGTAVYTLALGDFNRDGKTDVAAGGLGGMSILVGVGDGSFQAPRTFVLSRSHKPINIEVADGVGAVNVLLGNGDGTFQAARTSLGNPNTLGLAVGDFDGDGDGDIDLVGVGSEGLLGVFLNDGQW